MKLVPMSNQPFFETLALELKERGSSVHMLNFVTERSRLKRVGVTETQYAEILATLQGAPMRPAEAYVPIDPEAQERKSTLAQLLGPGGGLPNRKKQRRAPKSVESTAEVVSEGD